MRSILIAFRSPSALAVIILALTLARSAAAATYDLNTDFSDTANPNGVWTYNAAQGVPFPTHLPDWDPNRLAWSTVQPGWAYIPYPTHGHIPVILKTKSALINAGDVPVGSIYLHNNDGFNSPQGLEGATAGVSWTAPSAGLITITGGLWQSGSFLNRTEAWQLALNGATISAGLLTPDPAITSAAPLNLNSGSGGQAALTRLVAAGDILSLEFPPGNPGTGIGINFTVDHVPEPAGLLPIFALGSGLLLRRPRQ